MTMVHRIVLALALLSAPACAAPNDSESAQTLSSALRFLAAHQHPDGSWALRNGGSPVGMTAYGLVAFLAAGQTPARGPYARTVSRAIDYLAASVQDDGLTYREAFGQFPHNLYDQGSATFALSEACAVTGNEALRPKVRRAAACIVNCQDPSGGWKYKPVAAERPDLPVTALQLAALCAARTVGAEAPRKTIDRGVAFLLACRDEKTGGFAYTPHASNPGPSRTAAAVYALELCGTTDERIVIRGSDYLFREPTALQRDEQGLWFAYGRYYAAAAQRLRGPQTWDQWYPNIRAELLRTARRDRELVWWEDPTSNPPDPLYITALNATILALDADHLPLYRPHANR
jgi:squalene cyclase